MRDFSFLSLIRCSDATQVQSRYFYDREIAHEFDLPQEPDFAHAIRPALLVLPGLLVGGFSLSETPNRVLARLDVMYAEERLVHAMLLAKQRDLQSVNEQLRVAEVNRCVE